MEKSVFFYLALFFGEPLWKKPIWTLYFI